MKKVQLEAWTIFDKLCLMSSITKMKTSFADQNWLVFCMLLIVKMGPMSCFSLLKFWRKICLLDFSLYRIGLFYN